MCPEPESERREVSERRLDHWDEPLTDGDDPVEINQEFAQRLATS